MLGVNLNSKENCVKGVLFLKVSYTITHYISMVGMILLKESFKISFIWLFHKMVLLNSKTFNFPKKTKKPQVLFLIHFFHLILNIWPNFNKVTNYYILIYMIMELKHFFFIRSNYFHLFFKTKLMKNKWN